MLSLRLASIIGMGLGVSLSTWIWTGSDTFWQRVLPHQSLNEFNAHQGYPMDLMVNSAPNRPSFAEHAIAKIESEWEQADLSPWMGEYSASNFKGSLRIADQSGFIETNSTTSCFAPFSVRYSIGKISWQDSKLVLQYRFPDKYETTLLPIKWGERHYLIRTEAILGTDPLMDFVNVVNSGMEAIRGQMLPRNFHLRIGDENLPVKGLPLLPKPYHNYLHHQPLELHISEVLDSFMSSQKYSERLTRVRLNGDVQRLVPGMRLYVTLPEKPEQISFDWLTVTALNREQGIATLTHLSSDTMLNEGDQLSTRMMSEDLFSEMSHNLEVS